MFTDSTRHQGDSAQRPVGFLSRTTGQVRQFICGLHGHDALLHFESGRMSLLCTSCGYESPGWDVKQTRDANEQRQPVGAGHVATLPFVRARRAA